MHLNLEQFQKIALAVLLFALISLWNIPHTIAGRYACEALLLIIILVYRPNWILFFKQNKFLLMLFIYLFFQLLFFSTNYSLAISNFKSEWMHFILFSIIGAGVGLVIGKYSSHKILLYLAIAFSTPLYVHLILSFIKGASIGGIPWGYWGINEIHGDFGYPAMEASILLTTFYLYQAKTRIEKSLALGLIIACVASPLLAASRGGTGFTILAIIFVIMSYAFFSKAAGIVLKKNLLQLLTVSAIVLATILIAPLSDPVRWSGALSRISVGLVGNSTSIYCKGVQVLEEDLLSKGIEITSEIKKRLDVMESGDSMRAMAVISGYGLVFNNLMGIDQSKQAFQLAMIKECNGPPKIFIAHAHNAWIDSALAIGVPGAILLLMIMLRYAKLGWSAAATPTFGSPYGLALFASACLWIARGILDSTLRDQMLEMQAFVLALLLGIVISKKLQSAENKIPNIC